MQSWIKTKSHFPWFHVFHLWFQLTTLIWVFILFFGVGQWLDWKVIHKMILINQNKRIISKWKSTALSCIIYEHTVA